MSRFVSALLLSVGFLIGVYVQGLLGVGTGGTTTESVEKTPIVVAVDAEKFSEPPIRPTRPGSRVIPPEVSSQLAR